MPGLRRYVEWMTRGRRTERVVYVTKEWNLPKPLPGAEWQLDTKFNVTDELLRDPELKFEGGARKRRQGGRPEAQVGRVTVVELGLKAKGK
jgi:hypothetical protein